MFYIFLYHLSVFAGYEMPVKALLHDRCKESFAQNSFSHSHQLQ